MAQEASGSALREMTTGIERLDRLLGGLRAGDNVVWEAGSGAPVRNFINHLLTCERLADKKAVLVIFNQSPHAAVEKYFKGGAHGRFFLVDCFTHGRGGGDRVFSDFYAAPPAGPRALCVEEPGDARKVQEALEAIEPELGPNALYVFDSITGMHELWGDERKTLDFFAHMCPRLYDLDTVAYWTIERQAHSEQFLAKLRHITQVVVEISMAGGSGLLTVRKADARSAHGLGMPVRFELADDLVALPEGYREETELVILSEISGALASSLDLPHVFDVAMDILSREMGMTRGTLVLKDPASGQLYIAAAKGLSEREIARGRYKPGEGITGRVIGTGQPMAVPDISKEKDFLDRTGARARDAQGPVSFICVPLQVGSEVLGALSVDRLFVDETTLAKDKRLLSIIASMIAEVIKIHRMAKVEHQELLAENYRLRKDLRAKYDLGNVVGESGAMQEVLVAAAVVAKSTASVLIYGETGTGKELVASAIHYNSPRANKPFIKVNCGALSESLLESELFGHVRGAFTGAVASRKGRFELSAGGTIFLDEVSSMSDRLQVKLLRVLQEGEFEPVGGSETMRADVRVIAATNRKLEEEVAGGRFREDLFWRLNVVPIILPPLRERREDIPLLVKHFLDKYNGENGKNVCMMSREILDLLTEYDWPGNVRELENCVERIVVMGQSDEITLEHLPPNITSLRAGRAARPTDREGALQALLAAAKGPKGYTEILRGTEKAVIEQALKDCHGVKSKAAEVLGMSRNTFLKKFREHKIKG